MGIVKDNILAEKNRPTVIKDCAQLVDQEVASKKGIAGMIIKTGYKAFKAIKPSIVETAVDVLLDDFAVKLDEHYEQYLKDVPDKGRSFEQWAKLKEQDIADTLLNITDDMMEKSKKQAIKKVYSGLRSVAKKNVVQAVPKISTLVVKYAG